MNIPVVFPQDVPSKDSATYLKREGGMTLLDHFAGHIIGGMVSNLPTDQGINVPQLCDNAYMIAAWMLATRDAAHAGYPEIVANRENLVREIKAAQEKKEESPLVVVPS